MGYAAAWLEEVYLSCVKMPLPHIGTDLDMEGSAVVFMPGLRACTFGGGGWTEGKNFIRGMSLALFLEGITYTVLTHNAYLNFHNRK